MKLAGVVCMVGVLIMSNQVLADQAAKQAFDNNCKACHDVRKSTVGPSLVEIRDLYPIKKQQAFLDWTNNPGKKRPEGMQMPAMAHLGDKTLIAIQDYILTVSKGKNKARNNFSFKPAPKTYPYYQRGKMPFSSPAAVGLMFDKGFGLSWDAGTSRLRYAFSSKQSFFRGEANQQSLTSDIIYQETAELLWSFSKGQTSVFKGYRVVDELPQFVYQIGNIEITESFSQLSDAQLNIKSSKGFERHFVMQGVEQNIVMDLSHLGNVTLSASIGELNKNKLSLTPLQAKQFSITVELK